VVGIANEYTDILKCDTNYFRRHQPASIFLSILIESLRTHAIVKARVRQQQYVGKQRRIKHKHSTGTVGRYTLPDILR
jgi:hypothetical protein